MVLFDGGSASKVDDVTALPCHIQDGGYALLWQRYDNNKMVAMCYYGNVMTTTMSQYSDDVSSVTHAGCICAPVNAMTTCIYIRVSFCC